MSAVRVPGVESVILGICTYRSDPARRILIAKSFHLGIFFSPSRVFSLFVSCVCVCDCCYVYFFLNILMRHVHCEQKPEIPPAFSFVCALGMP